MFVLIRPADSLAGIFHAAGVQDIRQYYYWDDKQQGVCLEKLLEDLERAPERSVVVLSASAHYPTGADLSQNQWAVVTQLILVTDHNYIYALKRRLKLFLSDKQLLTPTQILICLSRHCFNRGAGFSLSSCCRLRLSAMEI